MLYFIELELLKYLRLSTKDTRTKYLRDNKGFIVKKGHTWTAISFLWPIYFTQSLPATLHYVLPPVPSILFFEPVSFSSIHFSFCWVKHEGGVSFSSCIFGVCQWCYRIIRQWFSVWSRRKRHNTCWIFCTMVSCHLSVILTCQCQCRHFSVNVSNSIVFCYVVFVSDT